MNLKLISQKLGALQSRGAGKSEHIWKAGIGKHQVRIVPSKFNKENPFKELYFHYGFGNKTVLALTNFGEADPIVEFAENLKAQKPYVEENWKFGQKMLPKIQVFVPVIVRGEEAAGVKLWQFGKEVYMELCKLAEDEEVGDYTDVLEGRDILVETVGPDQSGRAFNKTTTRARMKSTPLSENGEQVKQWLSNQPNPEELFTKPTYEELKKALGDYLNPSSEETETEQEKETTKASGDDLPWDENGKDKKDKYTLEGVGVQEESKLPKSKKSKDIDEQISKLFKGEK